MIEHIFIISDKWFIISIILLIIILIGIFYLLVKEHDIENKFISFGLRDDLTFLHKKITSEYSLNITYAICILIGFIIAYWDKISKHTLNIKNFKLHSLLIIIKLLLQHGFKIIMTYIVITKSLQFIIFFIIGYALFEIPFSYFNK